MWNGLALCAEPKLLWDFTSFNFQSTWNFTWNLGKWNLLWCKFHSHQFNRFLVACIFMEKCLIVCASAGLEFETGLSSLLVSCAYERSESQTSMRFSLVYSSVWQSLITWVFMQNPSNGDYIYWKWDSHVKTMKFHVGFKSQTILS